MPNPKRACGFRRALSVVARRWVLRPGTGPGPHHVTVPFQAGRSGILDLAKPHAVVWASVLDAMRQAGTLAYVEIDPATRGDHEPAGAAHGRRRTHHASGE